MNIFNEGFLVKITIIFLALSMNVLALDKTRAEFDQINTDFLQFYQESVPQNIKARMFPNWEINYPAAAAERSTDFDISRDRVPEEWDISILSGYYREELGSRNVHLLVLCHELAHHIGGAPYKLNDQSNIRWASMESQSDYYAAKTCMRKFFKRFPKWFKFTHKINEGISSRCEKKFYPSTWEIKACNIIGQAGLQLAWIHQKFEYPPIENEPKVSPETPDQNVATTLDRDAYASNQCRFDSHLHGALMLERPACWFPKTQE